MDEELGAETVGGYGCVRFVHLLGFVVVVVVLREEGLRIVGAGAVCVEGGVGVVGGGAEGHLDWFALR